MRRLTVLGAALTALMVLGMMASSAMAVLPEGLGTFPNNISKGEGGEGELTTLSGGISIKCKTNTVLGKIDTALTGTVDIHFKGCTALGAFSANSLGDEPGVILTGVLKWELCYTNKATKEVGIFIKEVNSHIEVPSVGALINVTGSIIAKVTPTNKSQTGVFAFSAEPSAAGDQKITECEHAGVKKALLLASQDAKHEKPETAAIKQAASVTFEKAVEIMA
jgi:hypothetical protein